MESEVKIEDREVCQNCTFFTNKPGWCSYLHNYMPRKDTCFNFAKKKGGK